MLLFWSLKNSDLGFVSDFVLRFSNLPDTQKDKILFGFGLSGLGKFNHTLTIRIILLILFLTGFSQCF